MACQMEDELWFAYLDQVARQERQEKAAADAADPAVGLTSEPASDMASAKKPAPASPFVCEEPPSE
jgi:hypothetical protein